MNELARVVLTTDLPDAGLIAGDVGTVVLVHGPVDAPTGYEVEVVSLTGETLAVVSVAPTQVRAVSEGEVAHSRRLAA